MSSPFYSIDFDRTHVYCNGVWIEVSNELNTLIKRDFRDLKQCVAWWKLMVRDK